MSFRNGTVTGLALEFVVDGRHVKFNFINPAKVEELMRDQGSLGGFLRGLIDSADQASAPGGSATVRFQGHAVGLKGGA